MFAVTAILGLFISDPATAVLMAPAPWRWRRNCKPRRIPSP